MSPVYVAQFGSPPPSCLKTGSVMGMSRRLFGLNSRVCSREIA